ncbi:DUF2220 domain-containing protein [Alicyclobacillus tolerans]|uniref:DUF2220 domain-containing protein n=1 Tax=Alicyclobacillus tolerans TaxID=90970 RepID=UPI001F1A530D|nr:DUF2220 domain-containing protein [Alicyclobacillus tolerans]MCF8567811.1 DUF2220 domain-containing protein [Alicyclobacillus tolerans]
MNDIRQAIEHYLIHLSTKRFEILDLEQAVKKIMGPTYYNQDGYRGFAQTVHEMVENGQIRPISSSGKIGKQPALSVRYQVVEQRATLPAEIREELLHRYHPKMQLHDYFQDAHAYARDKAILQILDEFLRGPDRYMMSCNERSFQLFRDEKYLADAKTGGALLRRVGLGLSDLFCELTHEPFFYVLRNIPKGLKEVSGLIIENKDTFDSFRRQWDEGHSTVFGIPFSLLVYGEGSKIIKSLPFMHTIETLSGRSVTLYYFGDFDRSGVMIWHRAMVNNAIELLPFIPLYEMLWRKYPDFGGKRPQPDFTPEVMSQFAERFPSPLVEPVRKFLMDGRYLPEEGIDRRQIEVTCS